ncbi:MAG TPA: AMP-binding protein [Tepidisphaeraceae bacterium]|nr:AMP-binding protein [Tepidisphaeraceae bacterium]
MLVESLYTNASHQPNELAVIDDHGQYTYQQIAAMASGLGMYLSSQTERPHVGLLLPASAGFVASFYGTLLAGKSVVPINYLLGDAQIAHVIADSGIDTVVTVPPLATRLAGQSLKVVDLTQLPSPPTAAAAPKFPAKSPDDMAVLMYTSGTSGLPKGVMLTFGNFQSDVDNCIEHAGLQHKHRFLGIIPLFHSFGITATLLAPIQLGSTVIYLSRFSPVATLNAIRKHNPSLIFGVPSMYAMIGHMKSATADDFKSAYALLSGGEPLPRPVYDVFLQRFGVPLLEGFGLTETSPVVAMNTPQSQRAGSVGKPVPGVTVKIIDDNGNPLPPEQSGEVWLKGPMIMKGYYNLPNETAAVLTPDGFFKTGDLGKVDADGFLYITGRKKELIVVGGEKVSPREVEEVLLGHPSVADVAVLGKADPGRGEVVVAFVTAKPNETPTVQALRDFCRDKGLAQWKCPREIYVVKDLPRSPTGKVLKRVLADQLTQEPPAN